MYIFLAALGLVIALFLGGLFFTSTMQETTAATGASAALLFSVTIMLGHLAKILNEQKKELQQQAEQLYRQTEYLRWMQQTAERLITAYVDSKSTSRSTGRASSQDQHISQKEPDRR